MVRRLLLAPCLALGPVAPAFAATVEVRVEGRVGLLVRLDALDYRWTARAEPRAGRAVFLDVPPGSHNVVLEASGGTPAVAEIRLSPRESVLLRQERRGLVLVSRREDGYGFSFDDRDLAALPTSNDAWSLLETAEPLAIADRLDTGGLYAGEQGRTALHGASLTQTGFRFGALDATDPLGTGTPLLHPEVRGLAAVDVVSAALPADTPGGAATIVLVPKRPTHRWRGAAGFGAHVGGTARGGAPPPIARLESWRDGFLYGGGPLAGERLAVFLAGHLTRAERHDREEPDLLSSERRGLLAHLVFAPDAGREARLLVLRHELDHPLPGRALVADLEPEEQVRFTHLQASWEQRSERGRVLGVSVGHQRGSWHSDAVGASLEPIERLIHGPVPEIPLPGRSGRRRTDASASWAGPLGGSHSLRLGLDGSWSEVELFPVPWAPIAERLNGIGARVWEPQVPRVRPRRTQLAMAAHVSDTWQNGRLALRGGVGLESLRARADLRRTEVSWLTASPEVRARFDLLADGRLAVVGAFSRRHLRLRLADLAHGDLAAHHYDVYRWDDDGDGAFEIQERGPLVFRHGGGAGALDPDLQRPWAHEFLAGFEWRPSAHLTLRFFGIDRRESDLLETVNLGVVPEAYAMSQVPDPGGDLIGSQDDQLLPLFARDPATFGRDQYLLVNPRGQTARHQGVELSLDWRGQSWRLLFGATAHRSEGNNAHRGFRPEENDQGLVGELLDQPNADTFPRGRLFSDRAYTIKIAGWRALRWDTRLGAVARYQDGQPFSRLVLARLPQGMEAVQAVPNGRHRFSYTLTVDARVEKGIALGGRRLALVGEAFNLLQTAHETEEDVVSGPGFRTPTARQPPRAFKAGLRLDF